MPDVDMPGKHIGRVVFEPSAIVAGNATNGVQQAWEWLNAHPEVIPISIQEGPGRYGLTCVVWYAKLLNVTPQDN